MHIDIYHVYTTMLLVVVTTHLEAVQVVPHLQQDVQDVELEDDVAEVEELGEHIQHSEITTKSGKQISVDVIAGKYTKHVKQISVDIIAEKYTISSHYSNKLSGFSK